MVDNLPWCVRGDNGGFRAMKGTFMRVSRAAAAKGAGGSLRFHHRVWTLLFKAPLGFGRFSSIRARDISNLDLLCPASSPQPTDTVFLFLFWVDLMGDLAMR